MAGMLLVVGVMFYSVGLCHLFQHIDRRAAARQADAVPDHVPEEWVRAYRSPPGG